MICEYFTPARAQFCFHSGISVQQAILQAQSNAQSRLNYGAVLDLPKSYDKVYRHKLIDAVAEYLNKDMLNMVRATLGPICARSKGDLTD